MKSEYTFVEVQGKKRNYMNSYRLWLERNLGYAGLSSWYLTQDPGKALAKKLGFEEDSYAIVFYRETDATYFKLTCPVDANNGYDPSAITEDYYF